MLQWLAVVFRTSPLGGTLFPSENSVGSCVPGPGGPACLTLSSGHYVLTENSGTPHGPVAKFRDPQMDICAE